MITDGPCRTFLFSLTVLSLLCLTCGELRAQVPTGAGVPVTLSLTGSATVFLGDDGGDPIDRFYTGTVTLRTSNFLDLFSASSGISYPPSAKLILDPSSGDVLVEDRSGNLIEDLTYDGYLSITLDSDSAGVWSGQINHDTGAQQFTGYYIGTLDFDDGLGDSGEVTGLTKELYSLSATDSKGVQKASDSITLKAVGEVTIYETNAVLSLTITASGRGSIANGKVLSKDTGDAAEPASTP